MNAEQDSFQPMNINFGLMPELSDEDIQDAKAEVSSRPQKRARARKENRQRAYAKRALSAFQSWSPMAARNGA